MDFETADGSQFWLAEIWTEREDGDADFEYTTVSALVNGRAYAGRIQTPMDEVDESELLQYLEAVPVENIFPEFPAGFVHAPDFDERKHYLKGPQFTYDDCQPGKTFVANCLLSEAGVLERLQKHPHANIISYHGCVTKEGRITNLCLSRCAYSLPEYCENGISSDVSHQVLAQIRAGIQHLHSLGLAHNDINPDNVCISEDGNVVLIDFDSCLPFGEPLAKGAAERIEGEVGSPISDPGTDFLGLKEIEEFLHDCARTTN